MCLDAPGGKGNDGDAIIIWPCKGSTNRLWQRDSRGEIVGIGGKCVDIQGEKMAICTTSSRSGRATSRWSGWEP